MIHILNTTIKNINNKLNINIFIVLGLHFIYLYNISQLNNKLNKLLKFSENKDKNKISNKKIADYIITEV